MKPFPHHYSVQASAAAAGSVELASEGLPTRISALEKAEKTCLITNSLNLTPELEARVTHG
jgi:hypothetical protein